MARSRRVYYQGWQDQRPGWTRRVKWFRGETDIRLNFCDLNERRECNVFYRGEDRVERATRDFDRFKAGTVTVKMLMDERDERKDG